MTAEQVNSVDHRIDGGTSRVLVHAHAPQRRNLQIGITEDVTQHPNLIGRDSRKLFNSFRSVRFEQFLVFVKRTRSAVQVRILVVGSFEVAERFDELAIVRSILDEQMCDAVGDRQIAVAPHFQIMLTGFGGSCPPRANIDERDLLAPAAAVNNPRKQHGMHFRRVVAPHDQDVARIKIVVAACRLVDAVRCEKSSDC